MKNTEIEVRFLEINKEKLIEKLLSLDAKDLGDDLLKEIIFYDQVNIETRNSRFVRLRRTKRAIQLTYKDPNQESIYDTEVEIEVNDWDKTVSFLEKLGLIAYRHQEKKRHTFVLGDVTVDIDTWPKIPTYVELEGKSEEDLVNAASKLGLDWEKKVTNSAGVVIEKIYKLPVHDFHFFTFDKVE